MPKRARSPTPESEPEEVPRIKLTDLTGGWNELGPDAEWDEDFVEQVLGEIGPQATHASKKLKKERTWGDSNASKLTTLLINSRLPVVSNNYHDALNDPVSSAIPDQQPQNNQFNSAAEVEALYLNQDEAYTYLTKHHTHPDIPIFVSGSVNVQLTHPTKRPLERFFDWQEDLDREVSVQDPTNLADAESYQVHTLAEVKEHFLFNNKPNTNTPLDEEIKDGQPWNVLDIGNPLPQSYPPFLSDLQTQLLYRIKEHVLRQKLGTRITAATQHWATWTEVTDWALLSEGGNLTAAHQDAHGLDTWIQVHEGAFGFGWMARPTYEEQVKWMADPNKEPNATAGDKWRYVILKPGQTVFFPGGLTHFVFRIKGYQTLATGGHSIRWNNLPRWLQVLELQHENPNCINEDLSKTRQYVEAVKHLVAQRVKHDTAKDLIAGDRWGNLTAKQYFETVLGLIDEPDKPWSPPKPKRAATKRKPAGKRK